MKSIQSYKIAEVLRAVRRGALEGGDLEMSGLSEAARGVSGSSTGALRGNLTIFHKYVENSNIWKTSFWGLLEQMSNIAQVL